MNSKVKSAYGKLVRDAMEPDDDAALYDMVLHHESGAEGYMPLSLPLTEAMKAVKEIHGEVEIRWDKSSLLLTREFNVAKHSLDVVNNRRWKDGKQPIPYFSHGRKWEASNE